MHNETITYRQAYQPPVFSVQTVRLEVDLYADYACIKNSMQLTRAHPGVLRLHGDELTFLDLWVDDVRLSEGDYHLDGNDLIIDTPLDALTLMIVTKIYPQKNTALSGLYRLNDLFCTQCEAEGFRRITYFPDRPDVLAVYTTRIIADKVSCPVLLSNGNWVAAGSVSDERHWVEWHDPFKKPSYLFALVAGQLACVHDHFMTCSGRRVTLRIYVEPGHEDKCTHAMNSLKRAMRWDEEQYGREYDLDVFMIVAVSDFNMGAMENKGLNIFNAKY